MTSSRLADIERRRDLARRDFQDPAKHYVRTTGWLPAAKRRATVGRSQGRKWLTYFTLPAENAIDVWLLYEAGLLEYDTASFPGVRYCEKDTETFVAIKNVLGGTRGWNKTFEDVCTDPEFKETCPYDILNLDFTAALFSARQPPYAATLDAIERLFQLQQDRPFDMFLTLKSAPGMDDHGAVNQLQQLMVDNLSDHSDLREAFRQRFGQMPSQLRRTDYAAFLLATVPKMIAGFAASADWDMERLESFRYSRGQYNILKLLFSFRRPPHDGGNVMIRARRYRRRQAAYVEAVRELMRVEPTNVDNRLTDNPALVKQLSDQVVDLIDRHAEFSIG